MRKTPPAPTLSLALGVFGHRPNRLPEATTKIEADIAQVLDAVRAGAAKAQQDYAGYFNQVPPTLSVVDALAEGADRLVATAALARGFVLDAPLPFSRSDYAKDFETAKAGARFTELLAQARSVLELPGSRDASSAAYERVGMTILGLSDLIVVVYDGKPGAGRGGTAAMLQMTIRAGLPVIYIDANQEERPLILWGGFKTMHAAPDSFEDVPRRPFEESLSEVLDRLLRPPTDEIERGHLQQYLARKRVGRNWRIEFLALQALLGVKAMSLDDLKRPDPHVAAKQFDAESGGHAGAQPSEAYGWASVIAGHFAQRFRSAYVANFVLAALAVVAAATSLLAGEVEPYFVGAEAVLIFLVIVNTTIGTRSNWHRRWIEAREICERLRVSASLASVALRTAAFADEEPTWTGWYARAFSRFLGMRAGRLDADGLTSVHATLLALIEDQKHYNHGTASRMSRLEKRLERFGLALFVISFLSTLDHFTGGHVIDALLHVFNLEDEHFGSLVATAIGAALPALATASYGIRLIGDFEGTAERAERTEEDLDELEKAVKEDQLEIGMLRNRARAVADVMLGDVSSWRLSAKSRGLSLPG
jgi:hypothetical protein